MQPVRQEDKNRQVRNSRPPANSSPDRQENDALAWPQPGGKVSSEFGERNGNHEGIDIKNSMGSPIVAAASGIVVLTKSDPDGYGYYVVIDHGNGLKTLYAHMYPSTVQVEVGDRVEKGQQIASVGNYPQLVPYLHFEIHENGKPVDPLQYY
nr:MULTISPECIES: M23 family metallopeptidase [Thermoactinomyces]